MEDGFDLDAFEFKTSKEIIKSLSFRVALLRKKRFKSQKIFAEHIGMSFGSYSRFEKTGEVSLRGFISIIKGIGCIDELNTLFLEEENIIEWR